MAITGAASKSTGNPVIVTFPFPTDIPAYDASVAGFTPATLASFQAYNAAEQAQALSALNEWAAGSGIVFVQVDPGQGDINFQNVDFNTAGSGVPLHYVGSAAFSDQAGEVHQIVSGGNTIVEGNGTADFQILAYGTQILQSTSGGRCWIAPARGPAWC